MFARCRLFGECTCSGTEVGFPYKFFFGVVKGYADGVGGVFSVEEGEAAAVWNEGRRCNEMNC